MAGVSGAYTASASYDVAQTNAAVVAGVSGKRLVVHWATVSNGADAGDIRLTDGAVISSATITAISQADPTVITCGEYVPTGAIVTIAGTDSTPVIDGTHVATNVDATNFSIDVEVTVAGTTGTVDATGDVKFAGLLAANTPQDADASRAPMVLTSGCPLCITSTSVSTHRVNVGYTVETP